MLGQHVITNGAIFVPFGTAICFDHAIDFIHQFRPIRLAKFLDKKIVFDCFQLALLAPSNCGRIRILDWRPSSNGNSCQKIHVWLHSTLIFQIICILFDQFVALSHNMPFWIILFTFAIFIQKPCDDKQNLRGRREVVAQSAQKKPCMNFTQGLQAIGLSFAFNICNVLAWMGLLVWRRCSLLDLWQVL